MKITQTHFFGLFAFIQYYKLLLIVVPSFLFFSNYKTVSERNTELRLGCTQAFSQHIWGWTSHWLHFCTRSVLCLTEHTGGAHSTTWAELNGLWSKGLIKRRHTTCPLALHFVHSGFMGKMMRARFPTRIGDLQRTSTVKTWENRNKRCGLKTVL